DFHVTGVQTCALPICRRAYPRTLAAFICSGFGLLFVYEFPRRETFFPLPRYTWKLAPKLACAYSIYDRPTFRRCHLVCKEALCAANAGSGGVENKPRKC